MRELDEFLGSHFIYTYENGWEYEMYIKNEDTIDYRIHSGMVGGRWVRDQKVDIVKIVDGVIFFPKWVHEHPEITVCYQNEFIDLMEESRLKYDTYPKHVVPEFADITFSKNEGVNNEKVISQAPYEGMTNNIRAGKLSF